MKLTALTDAAKTLGISEYALRKGARNGEFPHALISGRYMFNLELLEEHLKQRMLAGQKAEALGRR